MNNKGQTLALGIISAIVIFIIGMLIINFLMPEVTTFRTNLNCSNPSAISDGTKLLCLVGDAVIPYIIVLVFSITIGGIISRLAI